MLRGSRLSALSALSFVVLVSWTARAQPAPAAPVETPPPAPPAPSPAPPAVERPDAPAVAPPPAVVAGPSVHHGHGQGHPCGRCGAHGEGERRPFFGGFGYASVGLMTGGFSAMRTTLSQAGVLGDGYDTAPTGLVWGGGGGGLYNRVWVGGKGFGLLVGTTNTSRGSTTLTGGGGGFELGYAVIAREDWLVVPFFGVGGFGYSLSVQNSKSAPLAVYANETIPGGGELKYTAGFATGELGIRASRLLFWGTGGLMVGAEIGYMSSLQRAVWESSTGTPSTESAELRGGYFRLLVGGGGFSFRERHGEHEPNE